MSLWLFCPQELAFQLRSRTNISITMFCGYLVLNFTGSTFHPPSRCSQPPPRPPACQSGGRAPLVPSLAMCSELHHLSPRPQGGCVGVASDKAKAPSTGASPSSPHRASTGAPSALRSIRHTHSRWCYKGRGLEGGCARAVDQRGTSCVLDRRNWSKCNFLKYRLYNCAKVLQDEFNEEIQEHNS
jgi:hypothetical protein